MDSHKFRRFWSILTLLSLPILPATAQAATFSIVDTGQSQCYNTRGTMTCPKEGKDFYGQDAQYQGHAPQYTDHGNGTITDNVTGLMWQKAFSKVQWNDAASEAAAADTGGYRDWRVPTVKELYSLINFDGATGEAANPNSSTAPKDAAPYLDSSVFDFEYGGENGRFIDAQYVTSTEYVSTVMGGERCFFGVNFADGRIKCYGQRPRRNNGSYYARYVRGRKNYGVNDFQDNGDQTIGDLATGLTWMQIDSGDSQFAGSLKKSEKKDGSLNWEEALDFCEDLSFAGQDDWRLPNAKELQSIVDYTRSPDTSNSAAIDALFETTTIQDESGNRNYPFFWSSTTLLDGRILGTDAVIVAFGEALGKMKTPGSSQSKVMDVHGAGAQRSDPKDGSASIGRGPQGDARRVYDYARCVRGEPVPAVDVTDAPMEERTKETLSSPQNQQKSQQEGRQQKSSQGRQQGQQQGRQQGGPQGGPPEEAIAACRNSQSGDSCSFKTPRGTINGTCQQLPDQTACVPEGGPPTR